MPEDVSRVPASRRISSQPTSSDYVHASARDFREHLRVGLYARSQNELEGYSRFPDAERNALKTQIFVAHSGFPDAVFL